MILTEEIFNNLNGKASSAFNKCEISTYLEIGVREGNTFKTRVPLVSKKSVAIDCWDLFETPSQNDMGRSRSEASTQHQQLQDKYFNRNDVEIIRAFSNDTNAINKFNDGYFDLIFIDGDHSYEGAKEDLNNWWSKCNTLFCGHDYMITKTVWNGVTCGVKQAVDEFVQEKKDEIKMFRVDATSSNPTWFIWKK
jgi:hypothetical protein